MRLSLYIVLIILSTCLSISKILLTDIKYRQETAKVVEVSCEGSTCFGLLVCKQHGAMWGVEGIFTVGQEVNVYWRYTNTGIEHIVNGKTSATKKDVDQWQKF